MPPFLRRSPRSRNFRLQTANCACCHTTRSARFAKRCRCVVDGRFAANGAFCRSPTLIGAHIGSHFDGGALVNFANASGATRNCARASVAIIASFGRPAASARSSSAARVVSASAKMPRIDMRALAGAVRARIAAASANPAPRNSSRKRRVRAKSCDAIGVCRPTQKASIMPTQKASIIRRTSANARNSQPPGAN